MLVIMKEFLSLNMASETPLGHKLPQWIEVAGSNLYLILEIRLKVDT